MQTMCAPLAASRFARSYDPLDRIDLEADPVGARNHDFDANGNRTTDGVGTTVGFSPVKACEENAFSKYVQCRKQCK